MASNEDGGNGASGTAEGGDEVVVSFARSSRSNRGNMRKRGHEGSSGGGGSTKADEEDDNVKIAKVNHTSIRHKHNPLVKSSARDKNKAAGMAEAVVEYETTHTAASSVVDKYNEDDDEELRAKEAAANKKTEGGGGDEKIYKGLSNYTKYVEKVTNWICIFKLVHLQSVPNDQNL